MPRPAAINLIRPVFVLLLGWLPDQLPAQCQTSWLGWLWNRRLELVNTVQAGTNPFGIAVVR